MPFTVTYDRQAGAARIAHEFGMHADVIRVSPTMETCFFAHFREMSYFSTSEVDRFAIWADRQTDR